MTREERIERALAYLHGEGPSPSKRLHEFQERDWYARARPAEKRTEIYDRDWTGSSAGGRIWSGARWSGGREM